MDLLTPRRSQQCNTSKHTEAVHLQEVLLGSSILDSDPKGCWLHHVDKVVKPLVNPLTNRQNPLMCTKTSIEFTNTIYEGRDYQLSVTMSIVCQDQWSVTTCECHTAWNPATRMSSLWNISCDNQSKPFTTYSTSTFTHHCSRRVVTLLLGGLGPVSLCSWVVWVSLLLLETVTINLSTLYWRESLVVIYAKRRLRIHQRFFVCLSVRQQDHTKTTQLLIIKFSEKLAYWPQKKQLDFWW